MWLLLVPLVSMTRLGLWIFTKVYATWSGVFLAVFTWTYFRPESPRRTACMKAPHMRVFDCASSLSIYGLLLLLILWRNPIQQSHLQYRFWQVAFVTSSYLAISTPAAQSRRYASAEVWSSWFVRLKEMGTVRLSLKLFGSLISESIERSCLSWKLVFLASSGSSCRRSLSSFCVHGISPPHCEWGRRLGYDLICIASQLCWSCHLYWACKVMEWWLLHCHFEPPWKLLMLCITWCWE